MANEWGFKCRARTRWARPENDSGSQFLRRLPRMQKRGGGSATSPHQRAGDVASRVGGFLYCPSCWPGPNRLMGLFLATDAEGRGVYDNNYLNKGYSVKKRWAWWGCENAVVVVVRRLSETTKRKWGLRGGEDDDGVGFFAVSSPNFEPPPPPPPLPPAGRWSPDRRGPRLASADGFFTGWCCGGGGRGHGRRQKAVAGVAAALCARSASPDLQSPSSAESDAIRHLGICPTTMERGLLLSPVVSYRGGVLSATLGEFRRWWGSNRSGGWPTREPKRGNRPCSVLASWRQLVVARQDRRGRNEEEGWRWGEGRVSAVRPRKNAGASRRWPVDHLRWLCLSPPCFGTGPFAFIRSQISFKMCCSILIIRRGASS